MRRRPRQLEIRYKPRRGQHGGWRPGAGRKKSKHSGVSHDRRQPLASRFPVHVSLKLRRELGNLRTRRCYAAIRAALLAGCQRDGFRVCHHSVQSHHIHLIIEAKDAVALSRGMQGLMIRMARKLNRTLGRAGRVFADRFFARALKTPHEVRSCIGYVLCNHQRHVFGKRKGLRPVDLDPYSNAASFDGWRVQPTLGGDATEPPCVALPETWLLAKGWRRHGLLLPAYVAQWGNRW